MKRFVTITALAVAALLGAPTGLSTWYGYGSQEPSTANDATQGYMWTDGPDPAGCAALGSCTTSRIYFNVYTAQGVGGYGSVTPNSAMLGSRVEAQGSNAFVAMFGNWVDCNHDGYVGFADGAVREYRDVASQAAGYPVDTTICPDTPELPGKTIHYGHGWVTELLPIANLTGGTANDDRIIADAAARVWGDHEIPVSHACTTATTGFGKGQVSHTGGMLQHLDCVDGDRPSQAYGVAAGADPTGTVGGNVQDPSTLYANGGPADQGTFGSEDSHKSLVSGEQDCSKDPIVRVTALNDQGPRMPGTPSVNPDFTIAGTTNETQHELPPEDCKQNDKNSAIYNQVEGTNSGEVRGDHKLQSDINFRYRPWNNRFGDPTCAGATGNPNVCGTPTDLGLPEIYNPIGVGGNLWQAPARLGIQFVPTRSAGAPDAFAADKWTFYASTSKATTGTARHGPSVYGAEVCGASIGQNVVINGWDCNPDNWYVDDTTGEKTDHYSDNAQIGDSYQFRDWDCYDSTLVGAGQSPTASDVGLWTVGSMTSTNGC